MGSGNCMVGNRETTQKKIREGGKKQRRGWKNKPSRADMVVIIRYLLVISKWHWTQCGRNRANRMKITGPFLPQWMFYLSAVSISYGENCSLAGGQKPPFSISQPMSREKAFPFSQTQLRHLALAKVGGTISWRCPSSFTLLQSYSQGRWILPQGWVGRIMFAECACAAQWCVC